MLLSVLMFARLHFALGVAQCQDFGGTRNYCTQWCNTAGKWGCGIAQAGNYTCSCDGCNGCPGPAPPPSPAPAGAVEFLALGDFGFGNSGQKQVASVMTKLAAANGLTYVVSCGDNIYNSGVSSVTDSQWESKWSGIYTGVLMTVPWYAVLGNHDWFADPFAEINKTKSSSNWRMPDFFYSRTHKVGNVNVTWLHLETNLLFYGPSGENSVMAAHFAKLGWTTATETAQLDRVEQMLKAAQSSTWIFVVGHQINLGKICGAIGKMPNLALLFEKYGVDAYMGGHTHSLAFRQSNNISYFLTGGGGQAAGLCGGGVKDWSRVSMGVLRGTITPTQFRATFYDETGAQLFTHAQAPRHKPGA